MSSSITDNRTILCGLLVECPMGKEGESCILKPYRDVPWGDRMEWAKNLPDKEVDNIVLFHKNCLRKRENPDKT